KDCCESYRRNLASPCHEVRIRPGEKLVDGAAVIVSGPPCQPFSVSGSQSGTGDSRNGFPAFLSAVRRYHPELGIFENVRGMLFRNKAYFELVRKRLESLGYRVQWKLLNAAHFGIPQNRHRLFVVAHHGEFHFPDPTRETPMSAGAAL